jgi:hypothetical protein
VRCGADTARHCISTPTQDCLVLLKSLELTVLRGLPEKVKNEVHRIIILPVALYECGETLSLMSSENHRLRCLITECWESLNLRGMK